MPPTLQTERLLLRPYTEADVEPAFRIFGGQAPRIMAVLVNPDLM